MTNESSLGRFRKLRGVTPSPNHQVHQEVSDYLEVPYQKPLKIVPRGFNRLALAVNALYYFDPVLMQMCREKPDGKYLDSYNAYLRNNPDDPLGDAHEEVHAVSKVINPQLGNGLTDFFRMYNTLNQGDEFSCETPAVYNCIQEGVADSVAIQIGLNSKDALRREKASEREAKLLRGDETVTPDYALYAFDRSVQMMDEILSDLGIRRGRLLFDIMWLQQDLSYLVGYPFVSKAVNCLMEQGVSTHSQAIRQIIKNPPSTISELREPLIYIRRVD